MEQIKKLTIHKQINIIIVRLGHHLISKTLETNLNNDFYQLLNLMLEYPFNGIDRYQKIYKINQNVLELIQIEETICNNELPNIEVLYTNLYYGVIDTFLSLDITKYSYSMTYYDHIT